MGGEVGVLVVTAILAILGFSVHDTIVVFDRIRENLKFASKGETFPDTVGKSLAQTFSRSINTSLTVVLVLLALFFFGGESTKEFALVLVVGIIAGTYSSIFFAAPLLVWVEKLQKKKTK
jgi:preprotein translocase subunit SecF